MTIKIYQKDIKKLIVSCLEFRLELIGLDKLQLNIYEAITNITDPSERHIADSLWGYEGSIDEIIATRHSFNKQKQEALPIVKKLEEECYSWLKGSL